MGRYGVQAVSELIVLIIIVPIIALVGLSFLGTAVRMVYRDVLGIDDKVSEWLDRQFGTGWGLRRLEQGSGLQKRLVYTAIAVVLAFLGCSLLRYGVFEPIAKYFLG
jgi:hypothetical protein